MYYYLAVIGQPRVKGKFSKQVLEVSGPYIGRALIPIPQDYHPEWINRVEYIYTFITDDVKKALTLIRKDMEF